MNGNLPLVWLGIYLVLDALRHGCAIIGSPGSGKSVMLKAFRGSLAALMATRPKFDVNVIDFDAKRDLREIHRLFPDFAPVFDLNPFIWADKYDILGGVTDPRDIAELTAQIIEISANSSQPFFPQAAQQCFRGSTTRHWLACRDKTDFADLILSNNSPERFRMVARSHPLTQHLLALVNDTEAGLSVMATLMNEVSKFEYIAALMRSNTTGRLVSEQSLLQNRFSVTSLPYDDKSRETLAVLTRLFLSRLQPKILADNLPNRYVPVILDELALIPKGVDLSLGAVKGREAGWLPVYSFQSRTMSRNTFGAERFDSIMSTVKTFIALNVPDHDDASWAAKRFADVQGWMTVDSGSSGPGGSSRSWSEQFMTLENVTAGMLQSLQVPTPGNPVIEGIMVTVPFKPFKFRLHIPTLLDHFVPKVTPAAPPRPRDPEDMILHGWGKDDLRRLRLAR